MLNNFMCCGIVTLTNRQTTTSNMSESLAVEEPMPQARWTTVRHQWKHEHTSEMRLSDEPCEGRCAKRLAWTAEQQQLRQLQVSEWDSADFQLDWHRYERAFRSDPLLLSSSEITSYSFRKMYLPDRRASLPRPQSSSSVVFTGSRNCSNFR